MGAVPQPTEEEALATATYAALLWALSRPGHVRQMPEAGEAPIVEALIDRECTVFAADAALVPVVLRTGAKMTSVDEAEYLFLGGQIDLTTLNAVRLGSDLYPDDAATLIVRARIGSGRGVRLTGPGVDGSVMVEIDGIPDGFWQWRAELFRYPIGFDVFFVDDARVLGLPRSTDVEVL